MTRLQFAVTRPMPNTKPAPQDAVVHDLRFAALVSSSAWSGLPQTVRQRFSKRLLPGASVTYAGQIVESRRTYFGWLLAQLCRLIGAPLPLSDDLAAPAVVTVTEDRATGGQFWTRMYGRPSGFPQVIRSSKRFTGPTGLEEYLGCGFGIALRVDADDRALHFRSAFYFVSVAGWRVRLPRWLAPGDLTISHIDRDKGWFDFTLVLDHPLFGEAIRQTGLFRERFAPETEEMGHD
jgi:hypothetical protein